MRREETIRYEDFDDSICIVLILVLIESLEEMGQAWLGHRFGNHGRPFLLLSAILLLQSPCGDMNMNLEAGIHWLVCFFPQWQVRNEKTERDDVEVYR